MKIVQIGHGKMGQLVEKLALSQEIEVLACFSSERADWDVVQQADVCIDFSHPDAVITHVEKVAERGKPLVVGTSGWYDNMEAVKSMVARFQTGLIFAQNFSLGMHLFLGIVKKAAELVNQAESYDIALSEIHHRQKVDSPSGTAFGIADILLEKINRKKSLSCSGQVADDEISVSSLRVGTVPGTHQVVFDSNQDTITLSHEAHDRTAWARGALEAAKWIQGKKGFFTIEDMLCNQD